MWSGEAKGCATCFDGPANAEPDAISRGWQRLIALGELGALVSGEKLLDDKEAALLQRRPVSRGLHASVRGPSGRDPQLPTKKSSSRGVIITALLGNVVANYHPLARRNSRAANSAR